jgi:hypothetical protein
MNFQRCARMRVPREANAGRGVQGSCPRVCTHAGNAANFPGIKGALKRLSSPFETVMHTYRQRLVRWPKHPTVAGYFWIAYFIAIALLIFT